MKNILFTEQELGIIIDSLQLMWAESVYQLPKTLGDIERKNWEQIKKLTKEIMIKIEIN
jgi:hypothetical protein